MADGKDGTPPPRVSVVMPVRNAMPFLHAAIASVLGQSFTDFEFLIRDDGSTDGSGAVLDEWAARDPRIRVFHDGQSLGPAGSSNWIAAKARAPYVARMDADDESAPGRLSRQVAALDADAGAVLVGTLWRGIDAAGRLIRGQDRWRLTNPSVFPPFPHGSVMYRQDAFVAVGGYREAARFWEDMDLVLRMAERGKVLVIADAFYSHRFSHVSARSSSRQAEVQASVDLMLACADSYRRTGSYEALLDRCRSEEARVNPKAYVSIASNVVWSGQRPHGLRQLWRHARLNADWNSLRSLAWFAVARLSPNLLRAAMRATIDSRDRIARGRIVQGAIYEWRPSRGTNSGKSKATPAT